jgi:hypothetical protein
MRAPVEALNITRDQVALRALERAVERVRQLERQIEATFKELDTALAGCRENGIDAAVRFTKPVDAAWAGWRNKGYADS